MSTVQEIKIQLLNENTVLSDETSMNGSILTHSQKIVVNYKLSIALQALVNLVLDPEHPQDFIQSQSFLKGEISTYGRLLDDSREAEAVSENLMQNQ